MITALVLALAMPTALRALATLAQRRKLAHLEATGGL